MGYQNVAFFHVKLTNKKLTRAEQLKTLESIAGLTKVERGVMSALPENENDDEMKFAIVHPNLMKHSSPNMMTIMITNCPPIQWEGYHRDSGDRIHIDGSRSKMYDDYSEDGFKETLEKIVKQSCYNSIAKEKDNVFASMSYEPVGDTYVDNVLNQHKTLYNKGLSSITELSRTNVEQKLNDTLCPDNGRGRGGKPLGPVSPSL